MPSKALEVNIAYSRVDVTVVTRDMKSYRRSSTDGMTTNWGAM